MRQIYPDLCQTTAEHPLADFPGSTSNAYLLIRDGGNVLFGCTGREAVSAVNDGPDHDRIGQLGGVGYVLLSHWHEATPSLRAIKDRFGAVIVCHARDAAMIGRVGRAAPDHVFWERGILVGDIEAIPTPGHTVGSACYLHPSLHGRTYLFTGDTVWPARGSWTSATFEDDREQTSHRTSLDLLATLRPDAVFSAIAPAEPGDTWVEIAPDDWPEATRAAKSRL